jgi:SAM-dependent methyltransferase
MLLPMARRGRDRWHVDDLETSATREREATVQSAFFRNARARVIVHGATHLKGSKLDMAITSRRAKLYRLSLQLLSWVPQKVLALFQAIWLGLLDANSLNEITLANYSGQGNDGFESKVFNFQGLWAWELDAVNAHFSECRQILVAGAGGGREVIALARLGFHVTAVDFCKDLTDACRRHLHEAGLEAEVFDAPADRVPEGLGRFDGILVGRGFYHHIPGRARRIALLHQCRKHIGDNAPLLIFDFFSRPILSQGRDRTFAIARRIRRWSGSNQAVELGDSVNSCFAHAFVPAEIEAEMAEAGFRMEYCKESPFGGDSSLAHAAGKSAPVTDALM